MPNNIVVREVTELVLYIIFSDYVQLDKTQKETALSAILVAPVESAKTAILNQFTPTKGILSITDLTAWGLQHYYLTPMRKGEIKRILIPDMINPANRKPETVSSLITFFNSYISWEGVGNIVTYAMNIKLTEPLRGSLLTTMATRDFKRMTNHLAAVGFLSRLLVIGYRNSQQVAKDILLDIAEGRNIWMHYPLSLPDDPVDVEIPKDLAKALIPQAEQMGRKAQGMGYRALNQLKMLCKCKALSDGRDVVKQEDVDRVLYLAKGYLSRIPDISRRDERAMYVESEKEAKRYESMSEEEAGRAAREVSKVMSQEVHDGL